MGTPHTLACIWYVTLIQQEVYLCAAAPGVRHDSTPGMRHRPLNLPHRPAVVLAVGLTAFDLVFVRGVHVAEQKEFHIDGKSLPLGGLTNAEGFSCGVPPGVSRFALL